MALTTYKTNLEKKYNALLQKFNTDFDVWFQTLGTGLPQTTWLQKKGFTQNQYHRELGEHIKQIDAVIKLLQEPIINYGFTKSGRLSNFPELNQNIKSKIDQLEKKRGELLQKHDDIPVGIYCIFSTTNKDYGPKIFT